MTSITILNNTDNGAGGTLVTDSQVNNSIANLYNGSPAFAQNVNQITSTSPNDRVYVLVENSSQYIVNGVTHTGSYTDAPTALNSLGGHDVFVHLSLTDFDGEFYGHPDPNNPSHIIHDFDATFERTLAHEMRHVWQHLKNTNVGSEQDAVNAEDAAMHQYDHESARGTYSNSPYSAPPGTPLFIHGTDTPLLGDTTPWTSVHEPSEGMQLAQAAYELAQITGSPLVMDVSSTGSGLSLSSLSTNPVYWDIGSEGVKHASGWVSGDTGLLCVPGADGTVHDNSQLFGNYGPNSSWLGQPPSANGFQTLAAYDSNSDGVINSSDTHFGDLRVWVDSNHDGISQSSEVHTLSDLGITSIDLSYSNVNYTISGNTIKQQSTFTMNGSTRTIADAWFAYDSVNTTYNGSYTLDSATMNLPDQRGYGTLPALAIAMSNDSTLLGLVQDLAGKTAAQLLDPTYNLDQKVAAILFQWAGVQNVDPNLSYTYFNSHIDAQKLAFLEKLMDQPFQDSGNTGLVGPSNMGYLTTAWNDAFSYLSAHILAQAGLGGILGNPSYNLASDILNIGSTAQDIAVHYASQGSGGLTGIAANDVYILRPGDAPTSSGLTIYETANSGTNTLLLGHVSPSDVNMWTDYQGNLFVKYSSTDQVEIQAALATSGASLADNYVQHIAFDNGTIWDLTQGLTMSPDASHELLYGSTHGDTFVANGIAGVFKGFEGDDTYVFTAGSSPASYGGDYIYENAGQGTDTIALHGISPSDVTLSTNTSGQLMINFGTDLVIVGNGSFSGTTGFTVGNVERIAFDDTAHTVWDLTGGLNLTANANGQSLIGTSHDDTLTATGYGDWLYGYGGNDTFVPGTSNQIFSGDGNNTYSLGAGNGTTYIHATAGAGTDTLAFHGIDPANVSLSTDTYGQLHVHYSSTDEAVLVGTYDSTNGVGVNVERITFDDSAHTTWDLTAGLNLSASGTWEGQYGTSAADTLTGTGYGNFLYGYSGNDTLVAGGTNAYLYGGAGADTFKFTNAAASNNVQDFSTSDGDKLDFSSILTGYDPVHDTLGDFITKTESGGNTIFSVDTDGPSTAHSMTQVAVLSGVTGLDDLATLVSNGTVIV